MFKMIEFNDLEESQVRIHSCVLCYCSCLSIFICMLQFYSLGHHSTMLVRMVYPSSEFFWDNTYSVMQKAVFSSLCRNGRVKMYQCLLILDSLHYLHSKYLRQSRFSEFINAGFLLMILQF